MNNPYSVLGVNPNASEDEIKKAYRRLAKQYHPDRPDGNEEQFKRVNEAYDTIKNGGPQQQQQRNPFNNAGPFDNFDDLFRQHFGNGFRPPPPRNKDVRISLTITLEELISQRTKNIQIRMSNNQQRQVSITIPAGITNGSEVRYNGYGENILPGHPGNLFVVFRIKHHRDYILEEYDLVKRLNISVAEAMFGTDKIIDTLDGKQLKVRIHPGTQSKSRLRIPEQGLPRPNQPNANMYIEINVRIPALTDTDLDKPIKDLLE